MTETGSIMGTAQYLSPEQAQGHAVSAGSDLYSIGVVLYEMLTGRVPFDAESAVTIALKHVSEAPTPPRQLNPNIPPELEQTVLWVLNKNASDRPADADQLITVLEHCREAIASAGAGQHTASMAAVAAAGAAAGAGAAIVGPGIAAYRQSQDQGHQRLRRDLGGAPAARGPRTPGLGRVGVGAARHIAGGGRGPGGVLAHPAQAGARAQGHRGADQRRAHDGRDRPKFQVATVSVPNRRPAGIVVAESPAAGTKADRGSTVTLTVSSGQGNASVPSVQGLTEAQATRVLRRAGLRVGNVVAQSSNRFAQGQVTGTNPGTARSVPRGTAVTLFVSSGQPQKKVPNVVGESQTQATEDLTRAGFNVHQQNQSTPTQSDVGNVISQSPTGNTNATAGSSVTIIVGTAPVTVSVPTVTGDPPATAASALTASGLQGGPADRDRHQPQPEWRRDLPEPRRQLHRQEGQHGDHHDRQAGQLVVHLVHHDDVVDQDDHDHADDHDHLDLPQPRGRSAQRVAVLAGGRSSEHEVSLASGASVAEGLRNAGHHVTAIEIGRDGVWRRDGEPVTVALGSGLPDIDVVFPVLHGPFGEDGTVQGLLECMDVPYVGAGVLASALCMNKVLFKQLMAEVGIPQVDYRAVDQLDFDADPGAVARTVAELGYPVFVKPARLGSSVGIGKVAEPGELEPALRTAFAHDSLAIVEAFAAGREVECSVLGNRDPIASEPGEILLAAGETGWYDYAAKYTPGGMELVVPARVTPEVRDRVRELAVQAFVKSGCQGLARVDFFIAGGEVLVNELNTMPGFTETSVFGSLFAASGIAYPELLHRLVGLALERHAAERSHRH